MSENPLQRVKLLFHQFDPRTRDVALTVCRAYLEKSDSRVYEEIRSEFDESKRAAKRAIHALAKLKKGLQRIEREIEKSMQSDIESLCNALRQAHVPKGAPALLPIHEGNPTLREYLRIQRVQDPAEPIEAFSQLRRRLQPWAERERDALEDWIRTRVPKRRAVALFSKPGALQYALKIIWETRTRGRRLPQYKVEEQIREVLIELDGGGPSIEGGGGCSAIRKAIDRLPANDKEWCDKFLAHKLHLFRT